MCAYKEIFCVYVIKIMLVLIRLHLKMWVQVAVLTELVFFVPFMKRYIICLILY